MRRLVLGLLLVVPMIGFSQEIDLEEFAERLFQLQDQDIDYTDIYESLLLYYTHPIDLNNTTEEELASLYVLSPNQITHLLDHIEKNGSLLALYELQSIESFDAETIRSLLPFVRVKGGPDSDSPFLSRVTRDGDRFFLLRHTRILQRQEGYARQEGSRYEGTPDKVYMRFRNSLSRDYSMGFTAEKDAGEESIDYFSAHVFLENKGPFSKIALGDFQLQVGQGLIFGAGFNPGKGAETINTIRRNTIGLRPYVSALETGFFRGAGISAPVGKFEFTVFGSALRQDGNLRADSIDGAFERFVNSIQTSGLHRTQSELASKDQVTEQSLGGFARYRPNRRLTLGFSGLTTRFDQNIKPSDQPYNFYDFKGLVNSVLGTYASFQIQNLNFFGEAARSASGGLGMTGGVLASLSNSLDLAVSIRKFDPDFHSFYGNAHRESADLQNESGTYWGLKFRPSGKILVTAYYDKFRFPWLRFGVDAPSQGSEWLGRFTWIPRKGVRTFFQVREERKELSITDGNLSVLANRARRNYIYNIDYRVSPTFGLRTRVQSGAQTREGIFTTGYAIIQDASWTFDRLKLSARVALFETDDFDNRQYTYEQDVLYSFSIPAYSGVGSRHYIMAQYRWSDALTFWVRYGQFLYRDRDTVGSGLDESQGPLRSELKWMLRWTF